MNSPSLSDITYDLLVYHGTGNYGLFERCFNKASEFLCLEMDELERKKTRNWVFQYLRCNGYLESFFEQGRSFWSTNEPALVQTESNNFLLIGDSQAKYQLQKTAESLHSSTKTVALKSGQSKGILPTTLSVCASLSEANKLAFESGLTLSLNFQQRLFDALPDSRYVYSNVLAEITGLPKIKDLECSFYSVPERTFNPIKSDFARVPGLYRIRFKNHVLKCLLVTGENQAFEIRDPEWSLLCLFGKLKLKLEAQYDAAKQILSIKRVPELKLPTLIERALRSGTMESPSITKDWASYSNVWTRSAWLLASKFPMIRVTNI